MLAATVRVTRDLDLAEECVQDAYTQALRTWPTTGVPQRVGAWLTTTARRRAVDALRRSSRLTELLPALVVEDAPPADPAEQVAEAEARADSLEAHVPDDRLRLVFTCCHPALPPEARVALTLRLVCGLTTAEVARAFLVSEATMAARITRAKKKIALARIPYRVPTRRELPGRLDAVVDVVRLVLTTGHTAPSGPSLTRDDLTARALDLARLLRALLPDDARVAALLGLVLLHRARASTREDGGRLVLLADQDRSRWDHGAIEEGVALVAEALRARPTVPLAVEAAIAAVHAQAASWDETDWQEVLALYDVLLRLAPSPVVRLGRAVAVSFAQGPAAGLAELDALACEPRLASYGYLAASRADLLRRLGRPDDARLAYEEALHLTANEVERAFLIERLESLQQ